MRGLIAQVRLENDVGELEQEIALMRSRLQLYRRLALDLDIDSRVHGEYVVLSEIGLGCAACDRRGARCASVHRHGLPGSFAHH